MAKYNGWANYETWAVKLWMDNDHGLYSLIQEEKENYEDQVHEFSEHLSDLVEDMTPEVEGMFSDLLNNALSKVDWYEIAESILND